MLASPTSAGVMFPCAPVGYGVSLGTSQSSSLLHIKGEIKSSDEKGTKGKGKETRLKKAGVVEDVGDVTCREMAPKAVALGEAFPARLRVCELPCYI